MVNDLFSVVVECEDGADAHAAYADTRSIWVLMEIEIKKRDSIVSGSKIVIVSNHDDQQLRAEACLAGACGYVLKITSLPFVRCSKIPDVPHGTPQKRRM